jgi:AraC family transcriptional regulator
MAVDSQRHRATYEARMHRVLQHIDRQLAEPLDLPTLAAVAHFSPFHFHRLFAAWTGERLGDYLRRRRLEIAAARLIAQPRSTVLDIALAVGFGSAEAFARAFRVQFGCTPSQWRKTQERKIDQSHRNRSQAAGEPDADHGDTFTPTFKDPPMNVHLIDREPVTVAYMQYVGPYGESVSRFWQHTMGPWMARQQLMQAVTYGISHDDPTITDPSACRYDACVEVDPDWVVTPRVLTTTLPGGRYAVMPFTGTATTIGEAWNALMRDWLPQSGWQLDGRPCFERYPADPCANAAAGAWTCDICIPIAPL